MEEKDIYSFSELCILDVFIHIIRSFYVGIDDVDDSRSTQEVFQAITNSNQEWKGVNGETVTITPYIFFDIYLDLYSCLQDNVSL